MMNLLVGLFLVIFIALAFGVGLAIFIFIKYGKKVRTYDAKLYRLGDGVVKPPVNPETGKYLHPLYLQDLIPYGADILERRIIKGSVVYRLKKFRLRVNEITPKHEKYWGRHANDREVHLLVQGESVVPMEMAYEAISGKILFRPIPAEVTNLVKGEILEMLDNHKEEKSTMEKITPWITFGIACIMLLGTVYLMAKSTVEISENNKQAAISLSNTQKELIQYWQNQTNQEKPSAGPVTKPPSIDNG